jgi:hypothetical protein
MAVSNIGDSGSVFLPLYTKFRYSKVSAPDLLTVFRGKDGLVVYGLLDKSHDVVDVLRCRET